MRATTHSIFVCMSHTKIVAILNVTPDSFSDPDASQPRDCFLYRAAQLIEAGADIIDVGAESTRPKANPVSPEEEWRRLEVLPELISICHRADKAISLDTRHAETAAKAIALGVDWINDVSGGEAAMLEAVKDSGATLVIMHSLTIPADANETLPESADAVEEVRRWAEGKLEQLARMGIERERIILDPGIGFGKTKLQSLELIMRMEQLQTLGMPLLAGHSRKSFLTLFTDAPAAQRDDVTLALSSILIKKNIDFLRVHDAGRHATLNRLLAGRN